MLRFFYFILGAAIANHVKVIDLIKEEGKIVGAKMRDELSGEEWTTKAKCVVNATGPFTGKAWLLKFFGFLIDNMLYQSYQ